MERLTNSRGHLADVNASLRSPQLQWGMQRPCLSSDLELLEVDRTFSAVITEYATSKVPRPDSMNRFDPARSGGASSMNNAIRNVASGSMNSSKFSLRPLDSKVLKTSMENRRVVRQAMVCGGSLRVRSCKLLWKPAALQLMVTTTTSLNEDEAHFDDCDDDSDDSDDDDVNKLTTMARPNKTHHYSLVFCYRSLLGHARRERIELDDCRHPVEFAWGEDGLLSTRFEFSIVYGSVGASGRRRTLTCRTRDAKDYLLWTEALRTVMEFQGCGKGSKRNRSTHAHTITSSKASSNLHGSFFDADVVEEQQQLLEREAARKESTPTSPTAATAAKAIAPPETDIAQVSALKPVPADIAAEFGVGRKRRVSVVVKPAPRPTGTRLQRRKQPASPVQPTTKSVKSAATLPPFNTPHSTRNVEQPMEVVITRPLPSTQRRRRISSAARLSQTRVRKISLSEGGRTFSPWELDTTNSGPKRSRLRVSSISEPGEKRSRVPSSPLAVLGALPLLQSPSFVTESPLDFIEAEQSLDSSRSTEFVNSLVKIAGVTSARQRQKLLQRQRKGSRPVSMNCGLSLQSDEDSNLMSQRSSRLNLSACDFDDWKSARSSRRRATEESLSAYLKAMECEL